MTLNCMVDPIIDTILLVIPRKKEEALASFIGLVASLIGMMIFESKISF